MTLHEELAKAKVPGASIRAALIKKGIEAERERIIKLLETDKIEREPVCSNTDCEKCPAFERGFDKALALIKGENK